jgi:ubiquinone/menaquinone biosynthesis C-methylase UbiE
MRISEKLMNLGQRPTGFLGRLAGFLMNRNHRQIYSWGLDLISIARDSVVLDVGCGGGAAIQRLARRAPAGKIWGIDHSPAMVRLTQKVNRVAVARNRVKITLGSVSSLPHPPATFDLVSAFETIQFWPNLAADLQEVARVLKPAGEFLIVNRYPPENSRFMARLQIKSGREYQERLTAAGFAEIVIDSSSRRGWIAVRAKKLK